MKRLLFTFFLLGGLSFQSSATHILGADLFYEYLGGNDYTITFIFYRDCSAGSSPNGSNASAPNTAPIRFRSDSCNMNFTIQFPRLQPTGQEISQICPSIGSACGTNNAYYGVQIYVYQQIVTLVPCPDWKISFTTCCRNNPIGTLVNPGSTNMYIEATLDNLHAPGNSSPLFLNTPVFMFCSNQTTVYNPNAYDPDGDSLSWEFITPFNTDPNSNVVYFSGYSASQPFLSNPPVSIDSITGQISVSPTTNIITVTAVKVTQWEKINGIPTIIGTVMRDMQMVSYACSNNLPKLAGINLSATSYNPSDTNYTVFATASIPISFNIYAYDPDTLQYLTLNSDTLIPNSSFSVSNNISPNPVGTFTWTPDSSDIYSNPHCFHVIVSDDDCPYFGYQVYTYCIIVIPPVIGIDEIPELPDFQVFPNPAKEEFTLAFPMKTGIYKVEMYNELGQMITTQDIDVKSVPCSKEFHFDELLKGVYYLKLSNGDLQRVKKIMLY